MKQQKNAKTTKNELKSLKELGDMANHNTQNQITGLKSFMNKLNPQ